MDLDEFLAFLRADFDYGTGQAVPFKEDFVQRVAALLSEAQPTSSHLQQLSGMVNTVRSAVRDKFAFKENLIVNGELDLGRASVYDFLYAYITLGRAYLENQRRRRYNRWCSELRHQRMPYRIRPTRIREVTCRTRKCHVKYQCRKRFRIR